MTRLSRVFWRALAALAALALTAQSPALVPLEAGMVIYNYDVTGFAELRFDLQRR